MPAESIPAEVKDAINECAALIRQRPSRPVQVGDGAEFDTLIQRINQTLAAEAAPTLEPIGTVHHFACTGGTIISKGIAAMPNVCLLSELDPLSTFGLKPSQPVFAPTDVIRHLRYSARSVIDDVICEAYLAALLTVTRRLKNMGLNVVIRDHSHSHFCTDAPYQARKTHLDLLSKSFQVRPVVTVRNPIESYISMTGNGWESYSPSGFDEYCHRYIAFLDRHEGVPTYRYEDFSEDPEAVLQAICGDLELDYDDAWQSLLPIVSLTGDSGRSSNTISPREPKAVSQDLLRQVEASEKWPELASRLGYAFDY